MAEDDAPLHVLLEIPERPEGKNVTVDGWYPREEALEEISSARGRWADREQ